MARTPMLSALRRLFRDYHTARAVGLPIGALREERAAHKSDLAKASYSFYRVGQYTTFAGYEKKRQGGVLFCGEHTSTDFQGFMEGAASEGKRAARQLAQLLGKSFAP